VFFDPMYLLISLPALILAFYAQTRVRSTFAKYSAVANRRRVTGIEAARILLQATGLTHIDVEGARGRLGDHYDPRNKILRLSPEVAEQPSVASLGVVAHEIGHAMQDQQGYLPLKLRSSLVPAVNLGSWLGPIIFIVGFLLLPSTNLAWVGVILFSLSALFALVTLPVELDASRRAMQLLAANGLVVTSEEEKGASSVLNAAALTYVAAVAQALSTLLYYVFLLSGSRRRR
jgi:uncharacterized protein